MTTITGTQAAITTAEKQLKAAAKAAAKDQADDLAELAGILRSAESLDNVLLSGLTTAFETGVVAGIVIARVAIEQAQRKD